MTKKIILVDGISTTGKSTAAQLICMNLEKNNNKARWYYEHEPGSPFGPPFEDFSKTDLLTQIIGKWETFRETADNSDAISVAEASLQNSIFSLLQFGYPENEVKRYLDETIKILSKLDVLFVFLDYVSAERQMKERYKDRNIEGERLDNLCNIMLNNQYCKRNNLTGTAGVVKYWMYINTFIEYAYDIFELPKLRIKTDRGDWDENNKKIMTFIGINYVESESPENLSLKIAGEYSCVYKNEKDRFYIEKNGEDLFLTDFPWNRGMERNPKYKLIYDGRAGYYISSLPYKINFYRNRTNNCIVCKRTPVFGCSEEIKQTFFKLDIQTNA